MKTLFSSSVLDLDAATEADQIAPEEQVLQVYAQIDSKREATRYQRMEHLLVTSEGN